MKTKEDYYSDLQKSKQSSEERRAELQRQCDEHNATIIPDTPGCEN